jgi:hypothetical protein
MHLLGLKGKATPNSLMLPEGDIGKKNPNVKPIVVKYPSL